MPCAARQPTEAASSAKHSTFTVRQRRLSELGRALMKRDVGSFHAMLRTARVRIDPTDPPATDPAGRPAVRPVVATVGRAPIITAGGRLQNVALSSLLSKALGNNGGWRGLSFVCTCTWTQYARTPVTTTHCLSLCPTPGR